MDKLRRIFKTNKKIMVFLFFFFIISIVFGSILPLFLSENDKSLVSHYLSDFVTKIGDYNSLSLLLNGLYSNLGLCVVIFILGISIVGVFVVIFLFFLKGFILGFSLSSIIINYGFKGILFGFLYLFPHQIINMFVFSILTCYSVSFSIKFILFLFKKYDFNIRVSFKKFFFVFCFSCLLISLCVLYESFLLPKVLMFIFKILGL